MNRNQILLVDGMALLFRGFYATSFRGNYMLTSTGVPTNGVYQFMRYFMDAVNTFKPSHVICCWDMGSKTFQTELYDNYKANRGAPPEELIPQFDLVKEVVEAFNVPNIGLENYEADDCIGTLAAAYSQDHDVTILTGDHDMLQLVNEGTRVAIMKKGMGNYDLFDAHNFLDKQGLSPQQIVDMKALTGDSADNYPGVKGIGDKTARKLLQQYKTVDTLLEKTTELTPAMQKKFEADLDMLHLSRELAQIKCDVPVTCELDDALWEIDRDKIESVFEKLEFRNLDKLLG
ncbi:DNA-directed DNA polymerase [Lentibacillus sp. JNUCC-1]|uniref:5'-3' exonuclease n=1 Tax=Lentibacillus sp. JNUCC-1 TaxID=2654513 RepID=UPI0012E72139|nr:5'-3' exonuclease H3TH domain-containing protein [Lentibacillus sp. JNUCC-1]MUV39839.1 DNA-directed DNA polymerase [Lentibacillus sp. JNUCC-1]